VNSVFLSNYSYLPKSIVDQSMLFMRLRNKFKWLQVCMH
jgi:hypothetical protein